MTEAEVVQSATAVATVAAIVATPALSITDDVIQECKSNEEIVMYVKKKFKRLSRTGAVALIDAVMRHSQHIKANDIANDKAFFERNYKMFNKNDELDMEVIAELRRAINGFLIELKKEPIMFDDESYDRLKIKKIDGVDCYFVDKNFSYERFRKLVVEEGGKVNCAYDFDKADLALNNPQNSDVLQHCNVQIMSNSIKFDYPIEYVYCCPQCKHRTEEKAYAVASTNTHIKCQGLFNSVDSEGEPHTRTCNNNLQPDAEISKTKDCYYYDVSYDDEEGTKHPAAAVSFAQIIPGFYECVLFRIKNPKKTELYQIVATKNIKSNEFALPAKVNENYLFTLQKAFDNYIEKQTGMKIYGLYPIKIALIMQKLISELNFRLIGNVQVVGEPSTGKSTILKYYLFLLNNNFNLSTNGLSVSIPALRGTKASIMLMGKEQKIVTTGYLGTFKSIQIDEAGENKELVQNLKTFLLEDNYSYDKAGATGIFNRRTAQICLSENLDFEHVGQYRGSIKKAYKELTVVEEKEKETWDESWDLFMPLYKYVNPYLYKIVREKRLEYHQKQIWWIDGYEVPLHERFPFYFYLVNSNTNNELGNVIKENVSKETISENMQLMKALKCDVIDNFFKSLKSYVNSSEDNAAFVKVDKILEEYELNVDVRMKTFYYTIVKLSRIINKRIVYDDEDFYALRWMLEKMGTKLEVAETCDYTVKGRDKGIQTDLSIVERISTESSFSSIGDDFDIKIKG